MMKIFQISIIFIFLNIISIGYLFSNCWDCDDNLFDILHDKRNARRVAFLFRVDSTTVNHDYSFRNHGEILKPYIGHFNYPNLILGDGGSFNYKGIELKKGAVFFILSGRFGGKWLKDGLITIKENNYSLYPDWKFSRNISGKKDSSYICDLMSQYQEDSKPSTNKWVEYKFVDGTISAKGMIKNGHPHGEWNYYYKNGNLLKTILYEEGIFMQEIYHGYPNGHAKYVTENKKKSKHHSIYYPSGQLKSISISDTLNNCFIKSSFKSYHKNGQLHKSQGWYGWKRPLFKNGPYIEYDQSGKTLVKGKYYQGAKVGKWQEHNHEKSTSKEVKYKKFKARKDGKIRGFHPNGKIHMVGVVDCNELKEEWTYYKRTNGMVFRKLIYKNGVKDGVQEFYEGGKKVREIPYVNGEQDGISILYNQKTGEKIGHTTYVNGKKDGPYTGRKRNSLGFESGIYKANHKIGKWITETINNEVVEIAKYNTEGKLQGEFLQFEKGTLVKSCFYKNNLLDGDYKLFYSDGSLKKSGQYQDGFMIGEWVAYNEDGTEHIRCIQSRPTLDSYYNKDCGYFLQRDLSSCCKVLKKDKPQSWE